MAFRKKNIYKTAPKILVIEDDQKDSELIVKALSDAGYHVEVALNGTDAIKMCQKIPFDAITLDLLLPEVNGWDVLRGYRSKGP